MGVNEYLWVVIVVGEVITIKEARDCWGRNGIRKDLKDVASSLPPKLWLQRCGQYE